MSSDCEHFGYLLVQNDPTLKDTQLCLSWLTSMILNVPPSESNISHGNLFLQLKN